MLSSFNSKLEVKFRKLIKKFISEPTSIDLVILDSKQQASKWIQENLPGAILFSDRPKIQEYAAKLAAQMPGDFLEMGVYKGTSISRFGKVFNSLGVQKKLFGIDTFRGLADDWSNVDHLDAFDLNGIVPALSDENITLIAGSVFDVLPSWLSEHGPNLCLIHFDMDLYEPTEFALSAIKGGLHQGALLLFDNLHSYPGWQNGEYRALREIFSEHEYTFKAFGPYQCLIEYGHAD